VIWSSGHDKAGECELTPWTGLFTLEPTHAA
jgi:hypothetical protein